MGFFYFFSLFIIFIGVECQQSKMIYNEIAENVTRVDKFINSFTMFFVYPCLLLPKFVTSYFTYFTSDSGNESFELPFPYW